tara:strand:+ start:313 stop:918 length:606 start_codon:yes stop_codon:yes gene_type:complete
MTNTTNVITLTMTKEETAILSSVLRHLSMDLGERIADAGKDEPYLTREELDALTGHMEVELGCVNRLAATLDDALDDALEEDLVKKAQFAMDHGTIEHPGNATKAEIVEAFQQALERCQVSEPIEAVKQSIRDAISDDPQPDWKDSMGDALDVIEAVEAGRDDLLDALQGLVAAFDADLHDLMIAKLAAKAAITQATGGGK